MKRLTEKYNGKNIVKSGHITFIYGTAGNRFEGEAIDKLAAYEQAEEQGLLLRLPCKVGDILYFAHHDRVISSEVLSVKYHVEAENHGVFIRERLTIDVEGISAEIDFCEIGKTVFLSEAEAEAKLAEMEGAE